MDLMIEENMQHLHLYLQLCILKYLKFQYQDKNLYLWIKTKGIYLLICKNSNECNTKININIKIFEDHQEAQKLFKGKYHYNNSTFWSKISLQLHPLKFHQDRLENDRIKNFLMFRYPLTLLHPILETCHMCVKE